MSYVAGYEFVSNSRNAGGTYDPEGYGYPWRIVLHTIEGGLSRSMVGNHAYPPHLWYNPSTRLKLQTVPLDRSAFALYQGGGSEYTNKGRALQVELAGYAAEAGSWPEEWLVNIARDVIAPLVDFVRSQGGDIDLLNIPSPGVIPGSASEYAPQRMSASVWRWFTGVCTHRHVIYNDHWDCGLMNVGLIANYAAQLLGQTFAPASPTAPATPQEVDVYEFHERAGNSFDWTGFVHKVYALDSAMVKRGDRIRAWVTQWTRDRNGLLLPPSGAGVAALMGWGRPAEWIAQEDGFHSVLVEEDGRGLVRAEGRST